MRRYTITGGELPIDFLFVLRENIDTVQHVKMVQNRVPIKTYAAQLQASPTVSEALLRDELLSRGFSFLFNEPLHSYIPDFYFPEQKKIVELDGKRFHNKTKDRKRDASFHQRGILTLRIESSRVFASLKKVVEQIEYFLSPQPKEKKGQKVSPPDIALRLARRKWRNTPKIGKNGLPKKRRKR